MQTVSVKVLNIVCQSLFVMMIISAANLVSAGNELTRTDIANAPIGTAGLGFGLRYGKSPYQGVEGTSSTLNDNQYDMVPLYLYEGRYLFMHGTSAGVHMFNNELLTVDLLGRYRFDRLEASSSDFLTSMDDREQTVDGGLSIGLHGDWGTLETQWVGDMLNKHNGSELDFTYRYRFDTQRWTLSPYLSYVRQDSDLANYYYGVETDEATVNRPAYRPGTRDFFRAGLNSTYHLTPRWSLQANVAFDGLGDSAEDSPLADKEQLPSLFLSATYYFGDVFTAKMKHAEAQATRDNEWSWRLNYGYNSAETFSKIHRGEINKDHDIDTNLLGLTLGKLLSGGPKVDFYGKFSLNRRLEENFQDDFWEYVAYMMAMGKGYAPWSERLTFRYGFGFGVSYAERVPYVERVKQKGRGRETSHLLNYLEAQLDFPVTNFFDMPSAKNCFVGFTLVHRSGIFASSDLIGNVDGGSNVITTHLECLR